MYYTFLSGGACLPALVKAYAWKLEWCKALWVCMWWAHMGAAVVYNGTQRHMLPLRFTSKCLGGDMARLAPALLPAAASSPLNACVHVQGTGGRKWVQSR